MFRKIILPVVILIFTQQNFYGTEGVNPKQKDPTEIWKTINNWINRDYSPDNNKNYPKLWWLWAFLDNVPFQYGGSKIWKHGEAYYGLSNGIGFFPSFLNFGWLKIGIGDAHINVINTIIKYIKTYTAIKFDYYCILKGIYSGKYKNPVWLNILKWWLFYTVVTDIHLFSFKFFNCVKIKIISIGAVVTSKINEDLLDYYFNDSWYFSFNFSFEQLKIYGYYFILSPRIEINIPGIIDLF